SRRRGRPRAGGHARRRPPGHRARRPDPGVRPMRLPRTGIGVDVHAYADPSTGRELWLAGLPSPGEQGLEGHSAAAAAAPAAAAAVLADAGIGALGWHSGSSDPRWAGASGAVLLAEAARRVRRAGFDLGNVSVQVIGNRPRLGPRRDEA